MEIYDTLKSLKIEKKRPEYYMEPKRIYLDEKTGKIVEEPLYDSSASALIHKTVNKYSNSAKEIHEFMFGN